MAESTIKAYNQRATRFETRWKKYLVHTHEAFLDRIETTPRDNILDVSGGTGLLARTLIDRGYQFDHFIVNDPSEQMLSIARDRLSGESNLSFSNQRVEKLPFEDNYFDRIFCLNSFHFYTHQPQVLSKYYAMLKPRGRLCLLDWNREGLFRIVNRIIKWSTSEYIDTRSLPELEQMLNKSRFRIHTSESWNWRYWKFLFLEGRKEDAD